MSKQKSEFTIEIEQSIERAIERTRYLMSKKLESLKNLKSLLHDENSVPEMIAIYRDFFDAENLSPEMIEAKESLDLQLGLILKGLIDFEIVLTESSIATEEGGEPC